MRKFFILAMTIIGLSSVAAHAEQMMTVSFEKDAQALFEKGIKAEELVKKANLYNWIGGEITITWPYIKSTLNDSVYCYKFEVDQMSTEDQLQVGLHSLAMPSLYRCYASVNVEVTAK